MQNIISFVNNYTKCFLPCFMVIFYLEIWWKQYSRLYCLWILPAMCRWVTIRQKATVGTFLYHKAGEWFPLCVPLGCLGHLFAVKLLILPDLVPQYLQVYCDFSKPAYGLWFPLWEPFGWREHLFAVKLLILPDFVPQYSQKYCDFSVPSYNLWLPLCAPSGWREHFCEVKPLTLLDFVPQYSQ